MSWSSWSVASKGFAQTCATDARRLHLLMKWVVSLSILSAFGTVIRDAAAYGAVPEDAGGAPGRRDGLLQRTEVAAARAGGGAQHVRGLAPALMDTVAKLPSRGA